MPNIKAGHIVQGTFWPGLGWDRSNINLLTENDMEGCDPAMGATNLRTLLCNIHKAKEGR